jgi:hypothetical protein
MVSFYSLWALQWGKLLSMRKLVPTLKEAHCRGPCRFLESTHTIEILPMRPFAIRLRFRVYAGRSNCSDCIGDIIRAKSLEATRT